MIELSCCLQKPTKDASRIICILRPQVVRTFAAKPKKLKKPRAKKKASKKDAAIEEDVSSKNLYPFCMDKGQQMLPSSPMSISPNKARIHKEDSRFYNVQDGSEICTFPSVSRVLSHTKPVSFTFAMKRWEENMNKELGEEGTKKLRKELSTQGHNFHKGVGDYLANLQTSTNEDANKGVEDPLSLQPSTKEDANKEVVNLVSLQPSTKEDANTEGENLVNMQPSTNEEDTSKARKITNENEDVNETHQHTLSFQNKLREILRSLSQRLSGLFVSVVPSEKEEEEVMSSSKHTKQAKKAVTQSKIQASKPSEQVIISASKQAKQDDKSDHGQFVSDNTTLQQQQQLSEILLSILPEGERLAQSVEHVVKDISEVYCVESMVSHMELGYVGTVDLVAKYKDEVCVIDWKTSHKPKKKLKDIHDFPEQVIAYTGAINSDKNYTFNVEKAAIVVVYFNGDPADVHMFDKGQCLKVWAKWLDRLEQYHKSFATDLNDVVDEYN